MKNQPKLLFGKILSELSVGTNWELIISHRMGLRMTNGKRDVECLMKYNITCYIEINSIHSLS